MRRKDHEMQSLINSLKTMFCSGKMDDLSRLIISNELAIFNRKYNSNLTMDISSEGILFEER